MSVTPEQSTTNLFLLEELDDAGKTSGLDASDLDALHAVSDWIKTFVAQPNKELGRAGTVCPFVPGALERHTLWLAPEHVAGLTPADVVELIRGYQRQFIEADPTAGDDAIYKSFVVVLTDLSPDRAGELFGDVLEQLAVPSYTKDGFVLGGFYEGNEGTAIYNASFRPFKSPVPFLLLRQSVLTDWKFFVDREDWLPLWARRYGASGAEALGEELRTLPWREERG